MRWTTVGPVGSVGQPGISIVLEPPTPGRGFTDDERRVIAEMMAKGSCAPITLGTAEFDGVFVKVTAAGAEVAQEPTDQRYGIRDYAFRDPGSNLVRINQVG